MVKLLVIVFWLFAVADLQRTELIRKVAESGRCADLAQTADARVAPPRMIPPGPPPLLSFRYYEGKLHHRFGNAELMLDDAGH